MFKIETGIPLGKGATSKKWPFADMNVGDSVLFTIEDHGEEIFHKAQKQAHTYASNVGRKFVTRSVDGGLRVWRVS